MAELNEQMYCSQQICIPPTYPYLLRQFAKAAIRTQPNDLLKWSTTYFRCLSLNVPPPVKPRLEYPIPRDHHGMTPGWLRALLYQMAGNRTVTFRVLWDRWIGACLQHPNLIQILVLGGFEDNMAIPWLRFIGLCAAHLTDNLTETMILICEILTEEPEGGSAMIPLETFVDLYQFLARIDASVAQLLKNYYFLDKFLELYQEKIAREYAKPTEEEMTEEGLSLLSSESTIGTEREAKKEDEISVVSCPSVTSQDPDNYKKLLMKIRAEGDESEAYEGDVGSVLKVEADEEKEKTEPEEPSVAASAETETKEEEKGEEKHEEKEEGEKEHEEGKKKPAQKEPEPEKKFPEKMTEEVRKQVFPSDKEDVASQDTRDSSVVESSTKGEDEKIEDDPYLMEDLERLKAVHQELMGEDDDELEKYKESILADAGLTPSQLAAPEHFESKVEEVELSSSESAKSGISVSSESLDKDKAPVDEREYEEVSVDAVPGIGAIVPEEMIALVCSFMEKVAKVQQGMVMPRNVRHYECPPLEVYNDATV